MSLSKIHYSKKQDDWGTPQSLVDRCEEAIKHAFILDAAATKKNAKAENYYTSREDGRKQPWKTWTWCNPPYNLADDFVDKALFEHALCNVSSVLLLAARTDTKRFHRLVAANVAIIFLRGRLKFSGAKDPAPFPSMLVVCTHNQGVVDRFGEKFETRPYGVSYYV